MMTKKIYLVQAREYVKTLVDGDVRTMPAKPHSQPDLLYEGDDIAAAKKAAASFVRSNPCECTVEGLSCTVAYWDVCVSAADFDEELSEYGEFEWIEGLDTTTLTAHALSYINELADGIERTIEEEGL